METPPRRVRRRAVGPPGAHPQIPGDGQAAERTLDRTDPADRPPLDDDERFHADRPPHHDR